MPSRTPHASARYPQPLGLRAALMFSVVGLACAVSATAQPSGPEQRPGQAPPPPVLRGPSVEDTSIPGTERAFAMTGDMTGPQARMLNREVPMGEFLAAIRDLNGPDTPDDLHLSPDQRDQFQSIVREFAQSQRQYMQEYREELLSLGQTLGFNPMELGRAEQAFTQRLDQGQRRLRRAAEGQPDLPPEEIDAARPARSPEQMIRERVGADPTPEQRAAIQRLREIRDAGPSVLEAQTKAWNVLDEQQQAFVQERLDQARARQQQQQGEMYVQEMSRRIAADAQGRPGLDVPGAGGATAQRLHRMIDDMTPEEQQMLLRFLEMRFERRALDGPTGRAGQRGSALQPPAPDMDKVRVPSPSPSDPL